MPHQTLASAGVCAEMCKADWRYETGVAAQKDWQDLLACSVDCLRLDPQAARKVGDSAVERCDGQVVGNRCSWAVGGF